MSLSATSKPIAPKSAARTEPASLDRRMTEIGGHRREIEAAVKEIRARGLRGDAIAHALIRHVRHPYFSNGWSNTWLTSGHRNTWLTSGYANTVVTSDWRSVSDAVTYILQHVRSNLAYDLRIVNGG